MVAAEDKSVQEAQVDAKRYTSIRLQKDTVEMLKERGRKGESYDDIIRRLLERRRR